MLIVMYADLHLRSTVPEARLDDYMATQDMQLEWLRTTYGDALHINAGDVCHKARERSEPIEFALSLVDKLHPFYGVLGNHDLLYHNKSLLSKTTMGVLEKAGVFKQLSPDEPLKLEDDCMEPIYIYGFEYGTEMKHVKNRKRGVSIAVYHHYVYHGEEGMIQGSSARSLLEEFPEYDIILTGDNHQQFVVVLDDRVLINPGSFKRDEAGQTDHTPMIFTFDTQTKALGKVPVPIDGEILDRRHLEIVQERDERLEQLSSKFEEARDITLDFHENVIKYLKENDVGDDVELKVLEWMG